MLVRLIFVASLCGAFQVHLPASRARIQSTLLPSTRHPDEPLTSTSPVKTLSSTHEFLNEINQKEGSDMLLVVLFHAHYCKLCQRSNIQFRKLAHNTEENVSFVRLETSHFTPDQLKELGVTRLPFVQIYRKGICVASFSTQQHLESKLKDTLQVCWRRRERDWKTFENYFVTDIRANRVARQRLLIEPSLHGPLCTLTKPAQLVRFIDEVEGESLAVVMFHSHFVESCRRAQEQYRKTVDEYSSSPVSFARIEAIVLRDETLCDLGVENYPTLQVYRCGELIAQESIGPSYLFKRTAHNLIDACLADQSAFMDSDRRKRVDHVLNRIRSSQPHP